ncbi:MAG: hypothetical protein ABSH20_08430 [Tepidisphaeraceae bacterium]|jgi:hypothetical protein
MYPIDQILAALDERAIARAVKRHDEARIRFPYPEATLPNGHSFYAVLTEYAAFHYQYTVMGRDYPQNLRAFDPTGGSRYGFMGLWMKYLTRALGGDESNMLARCGRDAQTGENGGLKRILDIVAQGFRDEAVENYIQVGVFGRYLGPAVYGQRVEIMRQFFRVCDPAYAALFDTRHPEEYNHDYVQIIRAYVDWKRGTRDILRRLSPH